MDLALQRQTESQRLAFGSGSAGESPPFVVAPIEHGYAPEPSRRRGGQGGKQRVQVVE